MSQLTVRCLGGFEVRSGERQITRFESQKVKALFAYLAVQRDRAFSREHLASLLWPDSAAEAARRNLRQAVYNLKSAFDADGSGAPILVRGGELRLDPEINCWVDVDAFAEARRRGTSAAAVAPHYLAAAVALYRGDFLAGFALKDSPGFELWQLAEQERLRERAVEVLRILIESYLSRGEFRLGIQYARRLVAIDPLSEQAHRFLIRLYSLSGQRGRALAAYEQLRDALHRELGVEPLKETEELYQLALKAQTPAPPEERGIGPLIPLVGRHEPYLRLRECWQSVLEGTCRLTVVEGEAGIGKTRLVKSFLDAASSQRLTIILKGGCSDRIPTAYQPFPQLLQNALTEDPQRAERALEALPRELLAHLALLVSELREHFAHLPPADELTRATGREGLYECIAQVLERLSQSTEDGSLREPLVLMLGDLQWARAETAELIAFLLQRLAGAPVWILGTCCPSELGDEPPRILRLLDAETQASVSRIDLQRLEPSAVVELASALVGSDQAMELAGFLIRNSEGLPLAVAEWINSLWDAGALAHDAGRWQLRDTPPGQSGDLEQLVQQRLRRLPTSTRRLASQAAVLGEEFDARLLKEAADEHPHVVEVGLELMLERWLIRQHSDYWMSGRREHDIVLWDKGARLGSFEFGHRLIWRSILEDVNPLRRQVMHRQAAASLENEVGEQAARFCERLAFHHTEGGTCDQAIVHLRRAVGRARAVLATDTARYYARQAVEVLDRLRAAARRPDESERWDRERSRAAAELEEIESRGRSREPS